MINPKISIIIPVYNSEKTIKRAIDSAIYQSFKNKEIIVVDDGSSDKSQIIIGKYNKLIRIIKTEHMGVSSARNIGVENSHGDYILFLDSDDYLMPDCLNIMINNISDFDILCCSFIKKKGRRSKKYHLENRELNQEQFLKKICKIGSNRDYMYVWGKLFNKDVIIKDMFPIGIRIGEDVIALTKAALKSSKIKTINKSVYVYDRGESAVTKKLFEKDYLDLYAVWELIKMEFKKTNPNYIKYADTNIWRQDYTILTRLLLSGKKTRKENINLIREANRKLNKNYKKLLSSGIVLSRKIIIILILAFSNIYLRIQKT